MSQNVLRNLNGCLLFLATVGSGAAAEVRDVRYGPHDAHKYDLYLPEGQGPFPVVLAIHGGGWASGDKVHLAKKSTRELVNGAGCALASINYRFIKHATEDGVFPPVMGPHRDALRALQHLRHNARRWDLNSERVGLFGGSAGACTSLWLALSPEQADPAATDEVQRQSSRVMAACVAGAQTSLDPQQMRNWVGEGLTYGGHAFGFKNFDQFLAGRDAIADWIPVVSPAALLSADDPPIYLFYGGGLEPDESGKVDYTHNARFGIGLAKLAEQRGAECHLSYRGHGDIHSREELLGKLVAILGGDR